jgi:hypothetical protein
MVSSAPLLPNRSSVVRCFRNLLLVTGPQLLIGKALALQFETNKIDDAKFGSNLLHIQAFTLILPTIDDGSTTDDKAAGSGQKVVVVAAALGRP